MLSLALVAGLAVPAAHTFGWNDTDFLLDGQRFQIRSGEMHHARIPREYWRHRLKMVRAMGCNTVCAYLFWNQHEPMEGRFVFSGQADVAAYCRIAHQEGLKVVLRPGPYSCAEWEFGGFPWWLLRKPGLKLRTREPQYLAAVRSYLLHVGKELAPLQWTKGGPIIMVQVENEYGSYGGDREYLGSLRDDLREAGFEVPLFTCDGPSQLPNDVRDDLFSVVNFGGDPAGGFAALRKIRPKGPLMCGEYYPGWFDSWGDRHHYGATDHVVTDLQWMLEHNGSFSIYMVHGGTSFGFDSGANCPPFRPQSTSYDYDAPITENGEATPKYAALREMLSRHLLPGETLPEPPAANPVIEIPDVRLEEFSPLMDGIGKGKAFRTPPTFEELGQGLGCVLYRTELPPGPAATVKLDQLHDYAVVSVDGKRVAVLDRRREEKTFEAPARDKAARLDILVEAMGRVNYGGYLHDRKGIVGGATLSGRTLEGWRMFGLPFDAKQLARARYSAGPGNGPGLWRGKFELVHTGDTFLDVSEWNKGLVWVNGHHLGRFWRIGPQQTLYLPGPWLRRGANEIVVLDLGEGVAKPLVRGLKKPILDQVRPG